MHCHGLTLLARLGVGEIRLHEFVVDVLHVRRETVAHPAVGRVQRRATEPEGAPEIILLRNHIQSLLEEKTKKH